MLSKHKWYRSLMGGTWYLIKPNAAFPYIGPFWSRNNNHLDEAIKVERY